jgi:hypothetical protein
VKNEHTLPILQKGLGVVCLTFALFALFELIMMSVAAYRNNYWVDQPWGLAHFRISAIITTAVVGCASLMLGAAGMGMLLAWRSVLSSLLVSSSTVVLYFLTLPVIVADADQLTALTMLNNGMWVQWRTCFVIWGPAVQLFIAYQQRTTFGSRA